MSNLTTYRSDSRDGFSAARAWSSLDDAELRRRATRAAHERDLNALCHLALAHATLTNRGHGGGPWTHATVKNVRIGLKRLLQEWEGESLVRPSRDAGFRFTLALQSSGLSAATVEARLAAARALYRALRWAGATTATPFEGIRAPKSPTPAWERRMPYTEGELRRLLDATDARRHRQREDTHLVERVVVLLGAHAGLRASEMLALEWDDVDLEHAVLVVRRGKGGKRRTVNMSPALVGALHGARALSRPLGTTRAYPTLGFLMRRLCDAAGVKRRGLHALRHAAGTRLLKATGSLLDVANHLGHAQLDTSRVYAKWSDTTVRDAVAQWGPS